VEAAPPLVWGETGNGPGQFDGPGAIAVSETGIVYVLDSSNRRVQRFTGDGEYLGEWGGPGTGPGQFDRPTDIAVSPRGDVFVCDRRHRIQRFTADGAFLLEFGEPGTGEGQFLSLWGVAANESYVAATGQGLFKVVLFTPDGELVREFSDPDEVQAIPTGIAFAPNGRIWITDPYRHALYEFSPLGEPLSVIRESADVLLLDPMGLACDAHGNLYVASTITYRPFGHLLQKISPGGELLAAWGRCHWDHDLDLCLPRGIASSRDGHVFVTSLDDRVYRFGPDHIRRPPSLPEPGVSAEDRAAPPAGAAPASFTIVNPANLSVTVHDVTGRVVRRLGSADYAPGTHRIPWDGRDDAGRLAAAGVYFVRVGGESPVAVRKVVRTR